MYEGSELYALIGKMFWPLFLYSENVQVTDKVQ